MPIKMIGTHAATVLCVLVTTKDKYVPGQNSHLLYISVQNYFSLNTQLPEDLPPDVVDIVWLVHHHQGAPQLGLLHDSLCQVQAGRYRYTGAEAQTV